MDLEKQLKHYRKTVQVHPKEQSIKETVQKSIDAFCLAEQASLLTYPEFLWDQLRLIRKRWWILQTALLLLLWYALPFLRMICSVQRVLGAAASLFVILLIPELWKSQTYQFMEVEAVSYYSLRQIYAARMLLFGIIDALLLTFFCGMSFSAWEMEVSQLLTQFIFPMTITACICFGILCSKYSFGETTAVFLCMLWSAVWIWVVLDENIYAAITVPLWVILFGAAIYFLAFAIVRALHNTNLYWEGNSHGINLE